MIMKISAIVIFLVFVVTLASGLPQYAWGGPSDEEGLKRAYEDKFEIKVANYTVPGPPPIF